MVPCPRCPPGAGGLLALLLLLLPVPGARGQCGELPKLNRAEPYSHRTQRGLSHAISPDSNGIETVRYKCRPGFDKIPGKSDTVVCHRNSGWSAIEEFCGPSCGTPPRLKSAVLIQKDADKSYYPVGTHVSYECRPGYEITEATRNITCLESGKWSEAPEFCRGKSCHALELPNGRIDVTNLQFGATANFYCNVGYRLIGPTSAQCVLVGNGVDWDKEVPFCEDIPCHTPPDTANGSHDGLSGQEFSFGSAVTYKCDQGLSLFGEASIHCTTKDNVNGEWSGPAPECKVVKCPEPEVKNGKKQSGFGPDYSYGYTVIFACDDGYTLNGSSTVKCEANNSWVPSLPTCLMSGIDIGTGTETRTETRSGTGTETRTETRSGTGTETRTETRSGTVNGIGTGIGIDIPCHTPPDTANGSHDGLSGQEFSFGSAVTYKCDQGLSLFGEASIHCTTKDNVNGEWSGPAPECKVVKCPEPEVKNGKKQSGFGPDYSYGYTVIFACDDGYTLNGSSTVKCEANNSWVPSLPTCLMSGIDIGTGTETRTETRSGTGTETRTETRSGTGTETRTETRSGTVNGIGTGIGIDIPCHTPPDTANGSHDGLSGQEFSFGSAVTYKCDQGLSLFGEASIHCTTKDNVNGEWSGPAPECKVVKCPEPEVKNGKKQSGFGPDYSYGYTVIFACDDGYTLNGSSTVKCEANNSWVPSLPTCLMSGIDIGTGTETRTETRSGTGTETRTETRSGTGTETRTETRSGTVNGIGTGIGIDIPCHTPPDTANGSHDGLSGQEFSFGSAVTYKCDQGLSLFGEASIHCTTKDNVNGEWSGPAPECKVVKCPEPEVKNGKKQSGFGPDYSYGYTVIFACDDGYTLNGSSTVKCEANNSWVPSLPTCLMSVIGIGTGTETRTETRSGTGTETRTETRSGTGTETRTETRSGTGIGIGIGIGIGVIVCICVGIWCNKKHQKKKGCYYVNLDSPNTTL